MKNVLVRLTLLLLLAGQFALAQQPQPAQPEAAPFQPAPSVEDFKPSPINQPDQQYPQFNSKGRVRARIVAPQAQSVQLDISGIKYPMIKDADGIWIGDSTPQDQGNFKEAIQRLERGVYRHLTSDMHGRREDVNRYCQSIGFGRWRGGLFRLLAALPHATAFGSVG